MEESSKRPQAALINREWYESAKKVLKREQLEILLRAAVEYVIYGEDTLRRDNAVGLVFEMIKPALDSDINKYIDRCARNAANARSQWQRVAASGSGSQRVAANTTTTSTSTSTSTQISLREKAPAERERDDEVDKWVVFGYFWSTGSGAPMEELKAFWSYYESLGWKNNKGAAIVSRLAAARMWRPQFELKEPKTGAAEWFKVVSSLCKPDYSAFSAYLGAERQDDKIIVRICGKKPAIDAFCAANRGIFPALCKAWRVAEVIVEPA